MKALGSFLFSALLSVVTPASGPTEPDDVDSTRQSDAGETLTGSEEDDSLLDRVLLGGSVGRAGPQRADFATPDVLVVVYEEAWLDAVSAVVAAVPRSTHVQLLVSAEQSRAPELKRFARTHGASLHAVTLDTPWVRDYGPLQRIDGDGQVLWLDMHYASSRAHDDDVPMSLAGRWSVPYDRTDWTLDGGGIISNGAGLCAMTDATLTAAGVSADDEGAVRELASILGCEVIAQLPSLPDEPTGHADMIAQFVSRNRAIVVELDPNQNPADAAVVDTAARVLTLAAEATGRPLQITRVPAMYVEGELFSYVNGTRIGERFLTPWYDQVPTELQQRAYRALSDAMPGVSLMRIPADDVLDSAGAVHCITLGLSLPPVPARVSAP